MDNCRDIELAIDRELTEGLAEEERERLLDHLDTCPACSEFFDLLTAIGRGAALAEPSEHELARLRRGVLAAIRQPRPRPLASFVRAHPGWAAAALATVALGLGAAFGSAFSGAPRSAPRLALEAPATILSPAALAGLAEEGYRFAAATVEELGAERLRLGFDLSTRVEVEVERDHPLVAEVLVQSLASPAELGSRLRAVESAARRPDPRLRRALLGVMRRDESVAVRLAAQEQLLRLEPDPETVAAFLELLAEEPSVQMRLAAVDYLAASRIDGEALLAAIASGRGEGSRALLLQANSTRVEQTSARTHSPGDPL